MSAFGLSGGAANVAPRPLVHAAYDCNLPDRKNSTAWLDFDWDLIDVLHFGGQTIVAQPDGAATWWRPSPGKCDPTKIASETALIAHAHARGASVLMALHFNNSLGGDALFK